MARQRRQNRQPLAAEGSLLLFLLQLKFCNNIVFVRDVAMMVGQNLMKPTVLPRLLRVSKSAPAHTEIVC